MRNRRKSGEPSGELDSRDVRRVSRSGALPIGSAKEAKEGSLPAVLHSQDLRVMEVTPTTGRIRRTGLIAWITIEIRDLLRIENVTLRRTNTGVLTLSFPERIDAHGVRHAIVSPPNHEARHHLERAVFQQLRLLAPTLVTEES